MEDYVHIYCTENEEYQLSNGYELDTDDYPQLYELCQAHWQNVGKYIEWLNLPKHKWEYTVDDKFKYTNDGLMYIWKCNCIVKCDQYRLGYINDKIYLTTHLTTFIELDEFIKSILERRPETEPFLSHLKTKIYELDGEKYNQAKLAIESEN